MGWFNRFIHNTKIRNKLLIVYFTIVIVTVLTVGIYLTTRLKGIVIENVRNEARFNAKDIRTRFEDTLKIAITTSDMIYQDEKLHKMVTQKYENYGDVVSAYNEYDILSDYLRYYTGLTQIRLYCENDTLLNNSNIVQATDDVTNSEWYKKARAGKGIITWLYKYDEITKKYNLSLIRDISCTMDGQIGVLVISVNMNSFRHIITDKNYPATILVDNTVIASGEHEEGIVLDMEKENLNIDYYNDVHIEKNNMSQYIIYDGFKIDKSFNNIFQVLINVSFVRIMEEADLVVKNSIIIIGIAILLSLVAILYFSKNFSKRVNILKDEMHKVARGNFDIRDSVEGSDEIGELHQELQTMMCSLESLIDEVYVRKIQQEQLISRQKDAEFKMLASQINPHFLYNTLETIRMRAFCSGDKELAGIVKKLGKIMRRNLEVTNEIVSLESELELIKNYLEIQGLRFRGKVEYKFDIEVDVKKYKILPLLLQPIVENAFIHGIEGSKEMGKIEISIFENIGYLIIEISDNGVGISPEKLEYINNNLIEDSKEGRKRIGIGNVNDRIKMLYGKEYGLYIISKFGDGTKVVILLPVVEGGSSSD